MFGIFNKEEEKVKNVLSVRTPKTGGQHWAAWYIRGYQDKVDDIMFIVDQSASKGKRAFVVSDYELGTLLRDEKKNTRVFFDTIEITDTPLGRALLAQSPDISNGRENPDPTKLWAFSL